MAKSRAAATEILAPGLRTTQPVVTPRAPKTELLSTTTVEEATTLYRAVEGNEIASIEATGEFSVVVPGYSTPIQGVQGKYFYKSYDDALAWGKRMAAEEGRPFRLAATRVPTSLQPAYVSDSWVDGIQSSSVFYRIEDLTSKAILLPGQFP